jgi:peptide/nickel transport system ATP-binding protein
MSTDSMSTHSLNAAAPARTTPVLELRGLKVHHRTRTGSIFRPNIVKAVDGVDFTVRRGETVGVVGESGCGKSTLASVLVGLQQPTAGEVLFHGKPISIRRAAERKRFGQDVAVVFQDPSTALNPRMTIQVKDLLALVGLPYTAAEVTPHQVSGGQRQRVAIARALALDPAVIVADEPTSALDVSVRAQVLNLLADLKRELNLGMVFISHDIQTVRYVSDRICVMYYGRIVEEGPAEDIFANPKDDYTRKLLGAAPSLLHP